MILADFGSFKLRLDSVVRMVLDSSFGFLLCCFLSGAFDNCLDASWLRRLARRPRFLYLFKICKFLKLIYSPLSNLLLYCKNVPGPYFYQKNEADRLHPDALTYVENRSYLLANCLTLSIYCLTSIEFKQKSFEFTYI